LVLAARLSTAQFSQAEIWGKPAQLFEPRIKSWRAANVLVFAKAKFLKR
jgi:hypothetical protein